MSGNRAWIALVSMSMAVLALPVRAEVKDASASGFTIENSAVVPLDASTAWQALIGSVDSWWPKDHTWWGRASRLTIEARAGGCFCEVAGDRQGAAHAGGVRRSAKNASTDR